MLTYNAIQHLRDAYSDSPDALHLCDFSPEFATAWQDPTQRDALCELARRFLRATDRESEWVTDFPSTRYWILFRPESVFVTCAESHIARHNIRVDFLNWLLEQHEGWQSLRQIPFSAASADGINPKAPLDFSP